MSKIKWRPELIVVKKAPDELWLAKKYQSKKKIEDFTQKTLRASHEVIDPWG